MRTKYAIKRDSSSDGRKAMYEKLRPGDRYSGTAKQNIWLRQRLVADDWAPTLEIVASRVWSVDEAVEFPLSGIEKECLIYSELSLACTPSKNGKALLGKAKAGVFTLALIGTHGVSTGAIIFKPEGNGLSLHLLMSRYPAASFADIAAFAQPVAGAELDERVVTSAFTKFYDAFTVEKFGAAASKHAGSWIANDAGSVKLAQTQTVCIIWMGKAAASAQIPALAVFLKPTKAAKECLFAVGTTSLSFTMYVFGKMVDADPSLSDEEKRVLKLAFTVIVFLADLGTDVSIKGTDGEKLRSFIKVSITGVQAIVDQKIEEGAVKSTLNTFLEAGKRYISLYDLTITHR